MQEPYLCERGLSNLDIRSATRSWRDSHVVNVHSSKIGANNLPQFAGGATGYNAEMEEGPTSTSGPHAAWVAGDLDEADADDATNDDAFRDTLEGYSLMGANAKGEVSVAGGTVTSGLWRQRG